MLGAAGLDEDRALAMAVTSDGTRLLVGSLFEVHVFRLPELIGEHTIRLEGRKYEPFVSARSLAVSKDDLAFVGLERGEIVAVDVRAGTLERRWQAHAGSVNFIGLLPGQCLISGSQDGSVKIWHYNGDPLAVLRDSGDQISGGGVTRDGALAVTSSSSRVLTLWDLEARKIAATFTFDAPLWPCAITGDGRVVIAGDQTGLVHFLAVERN
jgi:WD40 repeat protein